MIAVGSKGIGDYINEDFSFEALSVKRDREM